MHTGGTHAQQIWKIKCHRCSATVRRLASAGWRAFQAILVYRRARHQAALCPDTAAWVEASTHPLHAPLAKCRQHTQTTSRAGNDTLCEPWQRVDTAMANDSPWRQFI